MTRALQLSVCSGLALLCACGSGAADSGTRAGLASPTVARPAAAGSAAPLAPLPGVPMIDNPAAGVLPQPMGMAPSPGGCNQDVDVVFSLDVSGSMTPSLTKLADEVGKVDDALKTKNLPGPPHYGLVIFVDDVMVMNGGQPYADVNALKAEVTNQAGLTSADGVRQVGPNDDNFTWPENSLDALYAAATMFQWRPAATTLRVIFHITDASFWDGTEPSSGAASEAPLPGLDHHSMHRYMEVISALREQKIWTNTFAAKTGGPPDGMMAPASHGAFRGTSVDVGIGFFEPYASQKSIPEATGGTAWDLDEVYDGKLSLGTPIQMSIEARQCTEYPM